MSGWDEYLAGIDVDRSGKPRGPTLRLYITQPKIKVEYGPHGSLVLRKLQPVQVAGSS